MFSSGRFYDEIINLIDYSLNGWEGWRDATILDVGVGFGMFGIRLREYQIRHSVIVDIDKIKEINQLIDNRNWLGKLDGIECNKDLNNPVWKYFYNTVKLGDMKDLLTPENRYDFVILNDVLEHVNIDNALKVLVLAESIARKGIFITTPAFLYGSDYFDSKSEEHLCSIQPKELYQRNYIVKQEETDIFAWKML